MSIAVAFPWTCEAFCCDRRINGSVILQSMPRKGVISNPSISHADCLTSCTTSLLAAGGYFLLHFTFFLYFLHLKRIVKAMAQSCSSCARLWWQWATFWWAARRDLAGEVSIKAWFSHCARSQRDRDVWPQGDGYINKKPATLKNLVKNK